MTRGRFVIGLLWAAFALTAGYALVPAGWEVALMRLKDGEYGEARRDLEARWRSGQRNWALLSGLSRVYVETGEIEKAVALVEEHLSRNPADSAAREWMGELYQLAQMPDRYRENLRELALADGRPQRWRELAMRLEAAGDFEGEAEALGQLVRLGRATPAERYALAQLQARARRPDAAIEVLRMNPDPGEREMELLVELLASAGREREARAALGAWLARKDEAALAARFGEALIGRGHATLAAGVLAPWAGRAVEHGPLLVTLCQAERASGKGAEAYRRLTQLEDVGKLPPEARPLLTELHVESGNFEAALRLMAQDSRPADWLLVRFLESAQASGRQDLAQRAAARYGEGALERRPLVAAKIAQAAGRAGDAARWLELASRGELDARDRLAAAGLWRLLGRDREALAQLERLDAAGLGAGAQVEAAWLWVNLGEARRGVDRFPARGPAWAIASVAAGRGEEVLAWTGIGELDARVLTDMGYLAGQRGDVRTQWEFARLLNQRGQQELYGPALLAAAHAGLGVRAELETYARTRFGSPSAAAAEKDALVFALLAARADDAVLPHLEERARLHGGEWFAALTETALRAGRLDRLTRFAEQDLRRGGLREAEVDERLRILAGHGSPWKALPYLRKEARRSPEWAEVYEATLIKLGRKEELVALWKRQASESGAAKRKRELAQRLLESGAREEAEPLFRQLAAGAGPESAAMADLLYVWGGTPDGRQRAWLLEQAQTAPAKERAQWVAVLLGAGEARQAARLGAGISGSKPEAYFRALQTLGERHTLGAELQRDAAGEENPERLRLLARLALEESLTDVAAPIFERLVARRTADREALTWLGKIAFAGQRYRSAEHYLERSRQAGERDPEALFLLGLALEREAAPDRPRIQSIYAAALKEIAAHPPESLQGRAIQAQLEVRSGDVAAGMARLRTIVEANPAETALRADYALLLFDQGRLAEAEPLTRLKGGEPEPAARRLAILRAQIDHARGRNRQAVAGFRELAAARPDPLVLTLFGQVEQHSGRWRRAMDLYGAALAAQPGHDEARRLRDSLWRQHRDSLRFDTGHRSFGPGWRESRAGLGGQSRVLPGLALGYRAEANAAEVPLSDQGSWRGVRRRAEMYLEGDSREGLRWRGKGFLGSRAGFGAELATPGGWLAAAEVRKPYWEFAGSLAGGGDRDRIGVDRAFRVGRVGAWAGVSWNHYHVGTASGRTAGITAGASLPFRGAKYPWSAQYTLDVERRTGRFGFGADVFPSREVHAASLAFEREIKRGWRAHGMAGIAADRLGGKGPFYSGRVTYEALGGLTLEAWVDRRLNRYLTTSTPSTAAGLALTLRYGAPPKGGAWK